MNLKDLFDNERKRVFLPGPFFTERVMARLNERRLRETGIWDIVPGSTRPVFAISLLLILCFLVVELMIPLVPQRGMIEASLDAEQSPAESFLYNESEVPSREVTEQLIALEDQQ
ncbi:MAG TPA: hypothetical protein VE422_31980 [Terriglobia bacterium]|nr:hypothetical protein [Terriglobia bacterium]